MEDFLNSLKILIELFNPATLKKMSLIKSNTLEYNFVENMTCDEINLIYTTCYKKLRENGYLEIRTDIRNRSSEDIHDIIVIYTYLSKYDWFMNSDKKQEYIIYVFDYHTKVRDLVIDQDSFGFSNYRTRCINDMTEDDFNDVKNFEMGKIVSKKKEHVKEIDLDHCETCGGTLWKELSIVKFCSSCNLMKECA